MKVREYPSLIKAAAKEWSEDKASRHAAALSYYTIFSLAPLLIVAIAVAGAVFGEEAARGRIVEQIGGLIGKDGASAIQTMIENANKPKEGLIAGVLGVVALLFGASGVFGQLQSSLNSIWEVEPKPGKGIWGFLRSRFLSLSMVLVIAFLLLVSLVLSAALTALGGWLGTLIPGQEVLLRIGDLVVSVAMVSVLFAAIFKYLPDAEIRWKDVWTGSIATAVLFTLGRYLIGLYLGRSAVGSAYGAAGSLVIVLLWIYYSTQILFYGAEFTQVYASRAGSKVKPSADAQAMTKPAPIAGRPALEPAAAKTAGEQQAASAPAKAPASKPADPVPAARAPESDGPARAPRRRAAGRLLPALRKAKGGAALAFSLAFLAGTAALRGIVRK
jgi:membrane protein